MTKRYWVVFGIAVAVGAIAAGTLILRAHERAAERDELLHRLLCPFSTQAQWDARRRRGDVVIMGSPDRGTARMRATVAGRPSWWTYEYERREGWPEAARIPRQLRDHSSILAAASLRIAAPFNVTQQIVVAKVPASPADVRGSLARAGWETIPSEVRSMFNWPESVSGMIRNIDDPDATEAVAIGNDTETHTTIYWMYWTTKS